jgi:hypothetical protein
MKKNILKVLTPIIISSFFLIIAFGSDESDKPKACDCVDIIYEGPDMNWIGKDETDDAMMAERLGWSKEKFNKWKKCRDAYPGTATVTLDCDKEKYKATH